LQNEGDYPGICPKPLGNHRKPHEDSLALIKWSATENGYNHRGPFAFINQHTSITAKPWPTLKKDASSVVAMSVSAVRFMSKRGPSLPVAAKNLSKASTLTFCIYLPVGLTALTDLKS
jgi:hypothetical protein